jgi:hypothetical protein
LEFPAFLAFPVKNSGNSGNSGEDAAHTAREAAAQATREMRLWAGRTTWTLRRAPAGRRLCRKLVELVDASEPLPTLAFII